MVYSVDPNPTMLNFGYPDSLVRHYPCWSLLVRPKQATLGALVLVCRDPVEAFPDISENAFCELAIVTRDIEAALSAFRHFSKINYLMLMMVDRDVHFHVLPRYDKEQTFADTSFTDSGWPGVPDLSAGPLLEGAALRDLAAALGGLRQDRAD